jgi:hypothetical protein
MLNIQISKLLAGCAAPALLLATIIVPACVVDEDFVNTPGTFACTEATQADDCIAGFECKENVCIKKVPNPIKECIDNDKDGYGSGPERVECTHPEEDFDDNDASRYPGADDICDGKDNDGDMTVDGAIACPNGAADCPSSGIPDNTFFRCIESVCVLKPANLATQGCDIVIGCNGEAGYDAVPEQCK